MTRIVLLPVGCIKIVNLQGKIKSSKKFSAELTFNFQIEATGKPLWTWLMFHIPPPAWNHLNLWVSFLVCLQDSVLAFWRHGMQGRNFKSNEVTTLFGRNLVTLLLCEITRLLADYSRDQWCQQDVPSAGFWQVRPGCSLPDQLFTRWSVHLFVCQQGGGSGEQSNR